MAKQLNVNLNFNANTTQAQQALQQLNASLVHISNITPTVGTKLSKDLQIAKQSAIDLQQHLLNAFSIKTGNLDLGKLDTSLKSAGQSLGGLSTNLLKAGTTGQQAFLNIQRAISNASVQINQANGLLTQFWTSLKNTARWQISSSILHGFIGSIQSAWGYAKDLDESLNNIRIVTGQTTEQMAKFAEQANKAAKALSTTTTQYTDAALIFYQQGLKGSDVTDRADITIKMANASAQSAEIVSDQLTAIWNNFYDGTDSLESYADKITALGAATASSSTEIATGLEKFASVAETVGLSYEYATAALATVTATTRQSADVVGTAFKTLFARLNDLKLGETLEDGTTLGQYTENLAKVGVNIKDASGQLKDMDVILEETAAKWKELDRDQQTALAKGVAGIRQYNQFIALMDNWDFMEENLKTVENSSGTLQKQADIYAESWSAAMDRVKASAEGIYRDLFPTEELTGLANGFATFLNGIDGLVQGLGGLKGILLLISSIVLSVFQRQLGAAIDSTLAKFSSLSAISINLKNMFSGAVVQTQKLSSNLNDVAMNSSNSAKQSQIFKDSLEKGASLAVKQSHEMAQTALNSQELSNNFKNYSSNLMQVNNVQALIEQSSKYLTQEQKQQLSLLQQQALEANNQLLILNDQYEMAKKRSEVQINSVGSDTTNLDRFNMREVLSQDQNGTQVKTEAVGFDSSLFASGANLSAVEKMNNIWNEITNTENDAMMKVQQYGKHITMILGETTDLEAQNQKINASYGSIYGANLKIARIMQNTTMTEEDKKKAIEEVVNDLKKENSEAGQIAERFLEGKSGAQEMAKGLQEAEVHTEKLARATGTTGENLKGMKISVAEADQSFVKASSSAENFKNKIQQVAQTLSNSLNNALSVGNIAAGMTKGATQITMAISSITNAIETFKDEEATFASKLSAGAMAASMGVTALMTAMQGAQSFIQSFNAFMTIQNGLKAVDIGLTEAQAAAKRDLTKAEMAEIIVQKLNIAEDKKEKATKAALALLDENDIKTTYKKVAADYANVASQAAKLWYITLIIAAITALVAITVALINKESEEEKQLRKNLDVQKEANEQAEKSAQLAEDIKSAFDNYKSIEEKLKNCTKGTKEWNDALLAIKKEIFEIMEKYPELLSKYNDLIKYDSSGQMYLDKDTMEQIISDQNKKSLIGSWNSVLASSQARKASSTNSYKSMIGGAQLQSDVIMQGDSNVGRQYGLHNNDNTIFVNNDYLEKIIGKFDSTMSDEELRDYLKEFITNDETVHVYYDQDQYDDSGDRVVMSSDERNDVEIKPGEEGYEEAVNAVVDDIMQWDTEIRGWNDIVKQAAEETRQATKLLIESLIPEEDRDTQGVTSIVTQQKTEDYKEAYLALMSEGALSEKYDKKAAAEKLNFSGDTNIGNTSEYTNDIYEFILQELQAAGYNWSVDKDNAVQGWDDGDRKLSFTLEDGTTVKAFQAEWIAQELASNRALAEINGSVNEAKKFLNDINTNIANANFGENAEGQQIAFKALMTDRNLENIGTGNIEDMYDAIDGLIVENNGITQSKNDGELTKEEVGAYLDKVIGDGKDGQIRDDTAQKYGFENAQDMIDTYYNNLNAAGKAIKDLTINKYFTEAEILSNEFNKLSLSAAEKFDKAFKKINLGPAGKEAGGKFIEGLNKMVEKLDEKDRNQALTELASVDWSSYDALDQAAVIMEKFGKTIDTSSRYWLEYADAVRTAAMATPDFEQIKKDLISISKILKNLKSGETISEEDYQTLTKQYSFMKKYFMLQADGTRLFIGNEKDMQEAVRQTIYTNQEKMASDRQLAEAIKEKDYDVDFSTSTLEKSAGGDGEDGLFRFSEGDKATDIFTSMEAQGAKIENGKYYFDGEEISREEASGIVLSYQKGEKAKSLVQNKEIQEALKSEGYTEAEWNSIIDEAMKGNSERLDVMLNGLSNLINQDYSKLEKEYSEMLASTATSIDELNQLFDEGLIGKDKYGAKDEITAYEKAVMSLTYTAITAAESLQELQSAWNEGLDTGVILSIELYNQALVDMAKQYSNCSDEIQKFQTIYYSTDYKEAISYMSGDDIVMGEIWDGYHNYKGFSNEQIEAKIEELNKQYGSYAEVLKKIEDLSFVTEDFAPEWDEYFAQGLNPNELWNEYRGVQLTYEELYHQRIINLYEEQKSQLEASILLGEAANKYSLNLEELSIQADILKEKYSLTAKQAANLAIQNQRMNKGVIALVDNFKDWRKEIEKNNDESQDYATTIAECTKAIADLVGASEDLVLPKSFFDLTENLDLLEQAARGSEIAIAKLGIRVAEAQINNLSLVLSDTLGDVDLIAKEEEFNGWKETVLTGLTTIHDNLNGLNDGSLKIDDILNTTDWADALNNLAKTTYMSVEKMKSILGAAGLDAEIVTTYVDQETEVPEYETITSVPEDDGESYTDEETGKTWHSKKSRTYTNIVGYKKVKGKVPVAQINVGEEKGSKPDISYIGNGTVSTSATKGSGSGKSSSKAKGSRKKKSDAVDRYKEVNDNLEKTSRLMQKNSTLADGLWGKNRINMLKENVKQMEKENELLEDKLDLANKYLTEDRVDLEATGVGFTFDNDGYITNYTDIMNGLFAEYESKWNEFSGGNEDAELSEEQQEVLDKMWEHIETIKTAYEKYETTLDEVQDLQQEQIEKDLQIQQENFAILQEELEIKLSINEDDLATIEYYLSKFADDFYSMFEAAALMVGDITKGATDFGEGSQGSIYQENLKYWEEQKEKLETSDITDEDYVEGLREVKAGIIENLQALQELDKAMSTYYVDTLRAGQEELAKYTAQMDRHNAVLEHYSNVLDIIGKSKDFESMGVVLEAQAHTAENAVKVAEENYNMLRKQADQRKAEYEAELAAKGEDDPGVQMLKKQWLDAEEVVGEAQDDMMQKTEEWAQALKAVVENELEGLAKELEKAFTANFGNSFEAMNTQMERAKSLQEEYLTTTNQVYETNKLIRQSQQEIDKTTNSVAKRRLKDFINETEQLQNKNKLSKFELEIQQAKYDLLLAEIALEEAQNAKSTVRLQRDSEGNFGYVYTADQNAIAEAEQKFADAQNSLYNIGLEGANDYTEKQAQALQEFYDTMTELQTQYLNGEIETEAEYQEKMAEAQKFYYEKLQSYSELYGIAVAVDANIVRDAWSTEFQSMTQSSAQWQAAITTYLAGVEQAFGKWADYVKQIRDKTIGPSLDDLKGKTEGIKTANDEVTKQITEDGGLLDALESEYDKVAALTLGYAELKKGIEETIAASEKTIKDIDKDIKEKSGYGNEDSSSDSGGDSDTSGTDTGSDSGSGSGDSSGGGDGSKSSGVATWDRGYEAYKKINAGAWSNYPQRRTAGYNDGFTDAEIDLGQQIIDYTYPTSSGGYGYSMAKAKQLLGFDTGGYTGDWGGSYGKLAMLHKKELVLNAGDTDNFLAGMEMLDNIVKTIDLYSMNAQLGGILSSPSFGFNNKIEPIEQNVHIEAHFPEATDRNEITEAINTLVNQASQFVNRK